MGRQKRELKNCKCCGKETYTAKGYCRDCNDSDLRYIKQRRYKMRMITTPEEMYERMKNNEGFVNKIINFIVGKKDSKYNNAINNLTWF